MPVGVFSRQASGLLVVEGLVALVGLQVDLDVVEGAVGLDPLVSVAGVAVHVAVRVRRTTVTEEVHDLVNGFLVGGKVVPKHGGILEVGLGVALLGVNEDGELGGITEEEDRGVIEDPVPIALFSVELDSEATGITCAVRRALLTTDGGEASEQLGLLANALEHVDDGDVADVIGDLELTKGASTLGVDNTLRDSLSVEVCEEVDQVEVLKQKGPVAANALSSLRVHNLRCVSLLAVTRPYDVGVAYWTAIGGGVDGLLIVAVGLYRTDLS